MTSSYSPAMKALVVQAFMHGYHKCAYDNSISQPKTDEEAVKYITEFLKEAEAQRKEGGEHNEG